MHHLFDSCKQPFFGHGRLFDSFVAAMQLAKLQDNRMGSQQQHAPFQVSP